MFKTNPRIAIIGLGYVGLPLAVHLAKHFDVLGFDINQQRIDELKNYRDHTHEVTPEALRETSLHLSHDPKQLAGSDIFIVTVPTPVTLANAPDLHPLQHASNMIGHYVQKNTIVVYESTVYPGVTETICGPLLEQTSGLIAGKDFFLGYSPERINPGDKEHTLEKITKVVAGQTEHVTHYLAQIYGTINKNNIFCATNIKTAEAAKVIENTQRDINIAFMNEITAIFNQMGLSTYDVLAAAKTKWNFLSFTPGLVGGHCIGVDPYYLADAAQRIGYTPEVILAGRHINENMGVWIATNIHQRLTSLETINKPARILVLGLTFKENVPDLRNTKVIDIIRQLERLGHPVDVHDPLADHNEARDCYEIELIPKLDNLNPYDCLIGAVAHQDYQCFSGSIFTQLVKPTGLIADIKQIWKESCATCTQHYWTL